MKGKKLLAGMLSAAMVLSTASFTALADEIEKSVETPVAVQTAVLGAGETKTASIKATAFEVAYDFPKSDGRVADAIIVNFDNVPNTVNTCKIELYSGDRLLSTTENKEIIDCTDNNKLTATIVHKNKGTGEFSGSWSTTINSAFPKNVPNKMVVTLNGTKIEVDPSTVDTYFIQGYDKFDNLVSEAATKADFEAIVASATAEDTILLTNDIVLDKKFSLKSNLDLGGHKLTLASGTNDSLFVDNAVKISNGTLVIPDNYTAGNAIIMLGCYSPAGNIVEFENLNIEAQNYKAGCGLIGINSGSTLKMTKGTIDVKGSTVDAGVDSLFDGNIGDRSPWGKLIIDGTTIKTNDTHQLFAALDGAEISNVTFEGVLKEFLFSRVSGKVENSTFKYTNAENQTIRAVLRVDGDDNLTFTNTNVKNIPGSTNKEGKTEEKDTQIAFLNNNTSGKVFMDDKTASCFADEAVKKVVPADGYYVDNNGKITSSKSAIIDTASASGVTVQLDDLRLNGDIDHSKDATYEVVVSDVSSEDKKTINDSITVADGESVLAYDIKVVKTENGKTEEVYVRNQKVTITLPVPVANRDSVKLWHIDNGTKSEITPITISEDGKTITFTAPSFSAYVVTYNATSVAEADITSNITVAFEQVATKQNEYDIVLKAESGKKINGLLSADFTFALTAGTAGDVSYEITPAANINLLNPAENRYEFHFDGINAHNATAENITIGRVVFGGYCTGATFGIANTATTNVVNTKKAVDSIVENYTVGGTKALNVDAKIDPLTIAEDTKSLTINIDFPNEVKYHAKDYQKMEVSIVSANSEETIALGNDMTADGKYVVTKELVKDRTYTVTVSGAGYRTARCTVKMNDNKTLNFWNNVKDSAVEVEEGNTASEKTTTFLAGELVKDGKINIYDLSAVVSYFGESTTDFETAWDYVQYDLNRDGTINSKDVAYVLASWNK